ncbi:MAG: hypothetical protein JXA41_15300 [Deltaproteobacteria bacterium]|nr:hypothetical protein [Deltaproteobacteria bacterium]
MQLFLFHAGFMAISMLCVAAGITIVKTPALKRRYFPYHRIAGIAGTVCVYLGLATAVVMVSIGMGQHVRVPHAWLGILTVLGMTATLALGFLQFTWKAKTQKIRASHRWLGRAMALLLPAAAITGLIHAGIL